MATRRESRVTRWAPWAVLAMGALVALATVEPENGRANPVLLTAFIALMCVVLVLRLVNAVLRSPGRRPTLVAMLLGLVMWMAGSVVLAASGAASVVSFPAPGEWLFLTAYVCLAAFVFLDAQSSTSQRSASAWADAAILCGGAAAAASAVLLTPLSRAYPDAGVGLLVAVLYPLLDLCLALLVVAQWALGNRAAGRRTATLAGGFFVLALADTSLVLGMPSGQYSFTVVADLLWGLALALLVEAAVAPPTGLAWTPPTRRVPSALLLAGFAVALLLLALRPAGITGYAVAASACLVLAAAGVRMVLALHAAQRASDALRLSAIDDLTGLPNRRALLRRLETGLRMQERMGLLIVDVDGFTELNDGLGYPAGDYLLRVIADRSVEVLPAGSVLTRLGSDVFAAVVSSDDQVVLHELGSALRSRVAEPIEVDGLAVSVRVSVGISWRVDDDVEPVDLLRRADGALGAAKRGGGGVAVQHDATHGASRRRLQMAHDLRADVRAGRLAFWYQPTVLAATGAVVSLEALVRWEHPHEGQVPAPMFLPIARREGLMLELSRQLVHTVVSDLARWRSSGLDVSVSVNIASEELLGDVLVPYLLDQVAAAGLHPQHVSLEIAENAFLVHPDQVRRVLLEARQAGLRAAIDDYGSGSSSLAYLRELPVSEVKLDRSFFAAICTDPRSAVIVKSTVEMAHALGMSVVAEGVETELVASRSIVLGVDALQGYYLSAAMPPHAVPAFVEARAIEAPRG